MQDAAPPALLPSRFLFEASTGVGGCVCVCVCWGAYAGIPRVCDGSGGDGGGVGMLRCLLLGL